MNTQIICSEIFGLVLPYSEKVAAPISYINVEIGHECPITEQELWIVFNGIKWDTSLSTSELLVKRSSKSSKEDRTVKVISVTTFEDDDHNSTTIDVENGDILTE